MLFTTSDQQLRRNRRCIVASMFLISVAFLFSDPWGFLILFAWIPLVMISRPTFWLGFSWGMMTFVCHFVWLEELLRTKTAAPEWAAVLLYLGVVFYFALTSGVWFWLDGLLVQWWMDPSRRVRLCARSSGRPDSSAAVLGEGEAVRPSVSNHMNGWRRIISWWVGALGYYWFLSGYSLWTFGRSEGYPFLNPAIPLAHYRWFLWLVGQGGLITQCLLGLHPVAARPTVVPVAPIEFIYCPPVSVPVSSAQTPVGWGQAIYHRLANLNLPSHDGKTVRIVVAPETFYQASLNLHHEQAQLWAAALPDDVHMILGSQATLSKSAVRPFGQPFDKLPASAQGFGGHGRVNGFFPLIHGGPTPVRGGSPTPFVVSEVEPPLLSKRSASKGRRGPGSQAPQKYYQTAYWLHQGLIKKYYVKKHRVPFVEKIPKLWRKIDGVKEIFLKDNLQFSRDHRPLTDGLWEVSPQVVVLPQLCSEFFFSTDAREIWRAAHGCGDGANFFIIFLVNDSWFVKYFKQILQNLTALKAAYLRVPVVYVGHAAMKVYES